MRPNVFNPKGRYLDEVLPLWCKVNEAFIDQEPNKIKGHIYEYDRCIRSKLFLWQKLERKPITPKVFSHYQKRDGNRGGQLVLGEILE